MATRTKDETLSIFGVVLAGLIIPLGGLIAAVALNLTIFRESGSAQRRILIVGLAVTAVEVLIFGLGYWGLQRQ